jgi:hypothetical protein
MAVRYTGKVFDILTKIRNIVEDSSMGDGEKAEVIALLNAAETLTQAGHLVGCGRTVKAFAEITKLTEEQIKATDVYKSLTTVMPGETVVIKCPREWFRYCRAILKRDCCSLRIRCREMKDGELMVTRLA